jgi:hypothetical protein
MPTTTPTPSQNIIQGTWINELQSQMVITTSSAISTTQGYTTYQVNGTYTSYVTDVLPPIPQAEGPLVGQLDSFTLQPNNQDYSAAVGFVVVWSTGTVDLCSVTSWSGQLIAIPDGTDFIYAIISNWLLTNESELSNVWQSSQIGFDFFVLSSPGSSLLIPSKEKFEKVRSFLINKHITSRSSK